MCSAPNAAMTFWGSLILFRSIPPFQAEPSRLIDTSPMPGLLSQKTHSFFTPLLERRVRPKSGRHSLRLGRDTAKGEGPARRWNVEDLVQPFSSSNPADRDGRPGFQLQVRPAAEHRVLEPHGGGG